MLWFRKKEFNANSVWKRSFGCSEIIGKIMDVAGALPCLAQSGQSQTVSMCCLFWGDTAARDCVEI